MNRRPVFNSFHLFFVLPAVALYGGFVIYPFLSTFHLSLFDWDGFGAARYIGVDNYYQRSGEGVLSIATDQVFRRALLNNVTYWIITLFSEVVAGLLMAALLTRCKRGAAIYRLALSSPLMIALVASAVLWRQMLAENGIVNELLRRFGLDFLALNWFDSAHAVYTISLISGWAYSGFFMLIFYAGLERIPAELREAAKIDGASEWKIFTQVELPLLRPVLAVTVLMCSTGAFRAFDLFYVIIGNGLNKSNEVASSWLVKNAFLFKSFGYASALAVVMVILVMGLAAALSGWVARERHLEEF